MLISVPTIRLFGRRKALPLLLSAIVAYTALVGASASVVRAAIMGALTLWATYLGRQGTALNSLFAAALLMTFLDPFTLGDVGFQLSFAATLGLVIYTRPLQAAAERGLTRLFNAELAKKIVGVLSDAIIVTLAAQITTLPILIVVFRQVSILTLAVNALVLPAQTGVMIFGGLALLAGLLVPPLGPIIAGAAWLFLTWTIQVIHLFAQVPGIAIELGYVDPLWGAAYVAVLAVVTFWLSRNQEQRMNLQSLIAKVSPRAALSALGMAALLGAIALSWQPDGKLHVHALEVDGRPVFVQTPAGRQILIGGSNSPSALLTALGQRLPFWDRDIDLIVVTRDSTQSLNGLLAVVDRYRVGQVVSVEIGESKADREWLDALATKSIEPIAAGASLGLDEGIALTLDESGAVRIEAGGTSLGIGPIDRADALIVDGESEEDLERIQRSGAQLVVSRVPIDRSALPFGVTAIGAEATAVELVFDGAQWEVRAAR